MPAAAALAALVLGSAFALWILKQRGDAGLAATPRELFSLTSILTCLQAWLAGAGLAVLAVLEVYALEADPSETRFVARAILAPLVAWLPIAMGLLIPVLRHLRVSNAGVFVDLGSAIAYSFALIGWVGTGQWRLAL